MPGIKATTGKKYITIVGGKLRQTVSKDTQGAQLREYETSDGKKGTKYELVFNGWSGRITGIEFRDGDYGKVVNVHFNDCIVQISKNSKYFSSLLEKLPNINFNHDIVISPYDFEDDGAKRRIGVSIQQNGEKIPGFFFDGKKSINGIPDGKGVNWKDEDERKMFFIQRDKFLIDFTEQNVIPKINGQSSEEVEIPVIDIDEETDGFEQDQVRIEDVPF